MIEEIVDVSDRDLMGVTSCFAGLTAWLGEVPDQTECLFLNLRAGRPWWRVAGAVTAGCMAV